MRDPIQALKSQLLSSADLQEAMRQFFELVEDPGFMDLGQPHQDPDMEALAQEAGSALGGRAADLLLTRLPEWSLIHGSFDLEPRMGGLIWFEDLDRGLAVAVDLDSGQVQAVPLGRPLP